MILIVDTSNNFIFNFFNCFNFLLDKYNFSDAYFIHQKQRIFVRQLGPDFFNNRESWLGLQQRYVVFNFVNRVTTNDHMFYDYTSSYFISRDIVFLPFNWYTRRFVYWDSSAIIRGRDGYFNIFSVDSTVLGYVNERSNLAFSGGHALVMADSSGNLLTPKIFADGKVLELNNASVIYPIVTAGFNCVFVSEDGGEINIYYGGDTSFNFVITNSSKFNSKFNIVDLQASIRRDPAVDYSKDRRSITSKNLDFIQAIQPAIVGVSIVAQPLSTRPNPNLIIPTNDKFVPIPSYQKLPFFANIKFNTYDFANNSYVQTEFRIWETKERGIAKSISSSSYDHISELNLYDNSLYYFELVGNFVAVSVQKTYAIPVEDNLFKFYKYNIGDEESVKFQQGYIDNNGSKVSSTKHVFAYVSVNYRARKIAIFDESLVESYRGSFSYYTQSNQLIARDEYSSLPEVLAYFSVAKIVITIQNKSLSDINFEWFNDNKKNLVITPCTVERAGYQLRRSCLSSPVYTSNNYSDVYLRTELPTDDFTVHFLWGQDNIVNGSTIINSVETQVKFAGKSYCFVVFTNDPKSQAVEGLISSPNKYGSILKLSNSGDTEGKMITIVDFPSSDDVRGGVEDSLFSYSIEESGVYNNKQSYVVSTYPEKSSKLNIKDETLLAKQYDELVLMSKNSPYPYKIVIADGGITKGIRMMKEAFRLFNYKSAENVVSFSVLLFPKWTFNNGYYYSNDFSYFNVSLLPSLNYISFNSLNTVKNSFSVIYSDLGIESYNRQHPFCIQSAACKTVIHKKYQRKNNFKIWCDRDLDVVVMTFSNYPSFNIFY